MSTNFINVEDESHLLLDDCAGVGDVLDSQLNNSQDDSALIGSNNNILCIDKTITNNSDEGFLKLMSWNIQGIGQKIELDEIRNMLNCYDIIFLYETMKLDTFDPQIEGYRYFHYQRKYKHPKARRPSGGIAVLIKSDIFDSKSVSIEKANEHVIWLKITRSTHEIFIGGTYIPPEGSMTYLHNKHGIDVINELREDLANYLERTPFVAICGDFNSRTGEMKDFEEFVNGKNSSIISDTVYVTGRTPIIQGNWNTKCRLNKDSKVNAFGKDLINLCRASGIRIMNGFYDGSNTDKYTCLTPMGQSTVDYLLCSESTYNYLENLTIMDKLAESDHTPLSFTLNFSLMSKIRDSSQIRPLKKTFKYIFDKSKTDQYLRNFESDNAQWVLYKLCCEIELDLDTDVIISTVYQYFTNNIQLTFKKKNSKSSKNTFPTNQWFDCECKNHRKSLNIFARQNDLSTELNKITYRKMHKDYKRIVQKKKRQFQDKNRKELENLIGKNQAECWKQWNRLKSTGKNQVNCPDLGTFHKYFEQQSFPPEREYFDTNSMEQIVNFVKTTPYSCTNELARLICDNVITEEEVRLHFKKQ